MPLPLIEASGTPFELGYQIGTAIQKTVQTISIHNEEFIAAERKWTGTDYIRQMMDLTRHVYPNFMEELRGMADGMAIGLERAFIWNCRGDLRWPDDITPKMAANLADGCTSVILPPTDGKPAIIAHNEDGSFDYEGHCYWLKATPKDGPVIESFLYPGMIAGHSMGANSAGIVQTINNIRVHDLKPGLPRHFICRAVLASQSMDEALSHLRRPDRASGFHHNLAAAGEGKYLSVEAPASGCVIKDVISTPSAHANHLIFSDFQDCNQEITTSSRNRQSRADAILHSLSTPWPDPTDILFDQCAGSEILRMPKDGGDDYGQTLATGIFTLNRSDITIDIHRDHGNKDQTQRRFTL